MEVVQAFLDRGLTPLELGVPSPFVMSCWHRNTEVAELLLDHMPQEVIRKPGPDGVKPLDILLRHGKQHIVEQHLDQFGIPAVLDSAIILKNQDLFEKTIARVSSPNWQEILTSGIRCNNLGVVKFAQQKMSATQSVLSPSTPCIAMRRELNMPLDRQDSFLTRLTQRYPVYNEEAEGKYQFYRLQDSTNRTVSMQQDILANALDPFCPFRSLPRAEGRQQMGVLKIEDLVLEGQSACFGGHSR